MPSSIVGLLRALRKVRALVLHIGVVRALRPITVVVLLLLLILLFFRGLLLRGFLQRRLLHRCYVVVGIQGLPNPQVRNIRWGDNCRVRMPCPSLVPVWDIREVHVFLTDRNP